MPVSKQHRERADLRTEAAQLMGIDPQYVFLIPKYQKAPPSGKTSVLAIWTEGWADEDIARVRNFKAEIKALAAKYGAKVYMTNLHPHEQEKREQERRQTRGSRYRERQSRRKTGQVAKTTEGVILKADEPFIGPGRVLN